MKKFLLLGLFALFGASLSAQMTTVTATVIDSSATAWANGSFTIAFVPSPSQPNINVYNINGVPLSTALLNFTGVLNGAGVFTQTLYTSSSISPSGSSWKFNICPNSSAPCGSINIATSGGTQN